MEETKAMSPEESIDILRGRINALEILAEEVFAELIRSTKDPETSVKSISKRSRKMAEQLLSSGQSPSFTATETRDSVTRLIQHLSLAVSGSTRPRSRSW